MEAAEEPKKAARLSSGGQFSSIAENLAKDLSKSYNKKFKKI